MMLVISVAVFALVCSVSAAPRVKRYDLYDSFPYSYAYTGAFAPFARSGFPFFGPMTRMTPMYIPIPVPDYSQYIPWYKGSNVCEEKTVIDENEQVKKLWSEGFEEDYDYSHESQRCKGDNHKYVCQRTIRTNDGEKTEMTKYECCLGFVRPLDGSAGCVESSKLQNQGSESPTQMKDRFKYSFSTSSFKGKSVDGVPIQ